jgi:phosphatidylserine/phosphatidylglycerophosphate/cardiolipin synthase-like enzyme
VRSRTVHSILTSAVALIVAFVFFQTTREHRAGSPFSLYSAPALVVGAEPGAQTAEEHFSPAENLEQIDAARLREATRTLDIAMYAFTDKYLADAIVERARAGVRVRVYRDHGQYEQENSRSATRNREDTTDQFRGENNIQVRVKHSKELMHLKAYLVDGKVLRTGSANWSPSGLKRQDNNAHFATDPTQVKAFQAAFEEMWSRDDNDVVQ